MLKKPILLSAFLSACLLASGQQMHSVWQIGKQDGSESEFALYGRPYNTVKDHYPVGVALYTVGQSSASDVPFVIPGPADSWAGSVNGGFMVHFGVKNAPENVSLKFVADFVEVHPSQPPRLEVKLNGFRTVVNAPAGTDQNYLDNRRKKSEGLTVTVDIPAGELVEGSNVLSVRSVSGSWMVLDDVRLEASGKLALTSAGDDLSLLSATSAPALVYGDSKDEMLHPVKLQFVNWGRKAKTVAWSYDGIAGKGKLSVAPGFTTVEVGIPEGYSGKTVKITAGKYESADVKIQPVDKWTIYLVQHTHTDIGYTKPQTEILTEHLRYIDYAIEYCEATEDYPDDSKFRWTCEAAWAVKEWLSSRPAEQVEKFLHFVKNGQIEVTAMFFNMSELSGENNYKTFLEPVATFHEYGIPVVTAMQNDVNGIAWCLADYLPDIGVKYITIGSNGHRADIPFNRPTIYKWESPSGKSIISYRADHYHTANYWGIDRGDMAGVENGVFSYISSLKHREYGFPMVAVQYSGYFTDNSPPSRKECELIKAWNEHYAWPKLRSATAHEFLSRIEEEYSDKLPVYQAAYPDWWTDGFGSAARESGASRETQSDMLIVESMLSMAGMDGDKYPYEMHDEMSRIHENLLFYDEHTFGAAESIRNPMCENSQVQWAEKGSYVWEALKSTQILYEKAVGRLQGGLFRSDKPTVTFFNPSGVERSAMMSVYIDYEIIPRDRAFRIVDEEGNSLAVQALRSRSEGRYYAIWAENVPAMGYKTYEIVLDEGYAPVQESFDFTGNVMENDWYRISFDPEKGGIVSLYDKELGKELVDKASEWKLGDFIYESLEGDRHQMERKVFEKYSRYGLDDVRITGTSDGDVYRSVYLEGKSRGCDPGPGVKIEVRLFNDVKRIEFSYSMVRLPETDPSGIYVAFPFDLDDSELLFDVPGGVVSAGKNQIPRTAAGWNTVQNFVSARNDDMQILVSCDAVPLFMMGELLNDPYRIEHKHDKAHVFSWVMNNYWTTNFRASQEGEFKWTYALTSTSDTSNACASEFGWGNRVPFYARVMPASSAAGSEENARSRSFFSVENGNVLMTSCSPSTKEEGAVMVNFRETDGKPAELVIYDGDGNPVEFRIVNVLDEPAGQGSVSSFEMKPYENVFVRISR